MPQFRNAHVAEGNPAFRAMGLPRLRAKLPSRNWSIFLTVVGSFTGAVFYDRRQKKRAQQKWCNVVSHLSNEAMPGSALPRKFMIYLSAPPGDGLRAAREHFQEYIKPILVAAAVDWEIVEGRKEGDVRMQLAEQIRKSRRIKGEVSVTEPEEDILSEIRAKFGLRQDPGAGDIIVGRHTWKEYMRGLHEGWLGPIDVPQKFGTSDAEAIPTSSPTSNKNLIDVSDTFDAQQPAASKHSSNMENDVVWENNEYDGGNRHLTQGPVQPEAEPSEDKVRSKPGPSTSKPYIWPRDYEASPSPPSIPKIFSASVVVSFPHLLGFLNTPIRVYRFLNRRLLADEIGQKIASILIFQGGDLPYGTPSVSSALPESSSSKGVSTLWEQQEILFAEENDWHKSARKPNKPGDEDIDRPWLEPMVIDERIGSRMTKPELVRDPASTSKQLEEASVVNLFDDGSRVRGKDREWKGGANSWERLSWGTWLKQAVGFAREEPQCKGWEHGSFGSEDT